MHFHLPKPLHGWRAFLGEVGIIVVGVLIALSAEQMVEAWHWRRLVDDGRHDLADDYSILKVQMRERELTSACLGKRLQQIAVIIDQASASGRLPPIGDIGQPRSRAWSEPRWAGLVANGTAAHFPRDEAERYTAIAADLESLATDIHREEDAWTRLSTIVGPGRRLDSGEPAALRGALSEAVYEARILRLASDRLIGMVQKTPLDTSDWIRRPIPGFDPEHPRLLLVQAPCKPIGVPPDHYGQAPMSFVHL